jgi:tetratricopeptide (TPR) repeat protein
MKTCLRALWMLPLTGILLAATPAADPEDYVRQGNAAFEREDYETALRLYGLAEDRITNPGLVAFNKAAALYRTGDYRAAEMSYRRCLEEASGGRRADIFYDLGNCLLMQSKGADAKLLRQALDCYALCLREPGVSEALRRDAGHNLELAKLLWLRARLARPNKDQGDPDEKKEPSKPEPKTPDEKTPGGIEPNPTKGEPAAKADAQPVDPRDTRQPIPVDSMQAPGSGNLPPVPDNDERERMLPEDAARHLQRAFDRVLRERREYQMRMAPGRRRDIPDY